MKQHEEASAENKKETKKSKHGQNFFDRVKIKKNFLIFLFFSGLISFDPVFRIPGHRTFGQHDIWSDDSWTKRF